MYLSRTPSLLINRTVSPSHPRLQCSSLKFVPGLDLCLHTHQMAQRCKWDKTKLIGHIRSHKTDFKFSYEHFCTYAEHRGVARAVEQKGLVHVSYLCTKKRNSSFVSSPIQPISSLHKLEMKENSRLYLPVCFMKTYLYHWSVHTYRHCHIWSAKDTQRPFPSKAM